MDEITNQSNKAGHLKYYLLISVLVIALVTIATARPTASTGVVHSYQDESVVAAI